MATGDDYGDPIDDATEDGRSDEPIQPNGGEGDTPDTQGTGNGDDEN